ncbi:intercellular trafficking and secretion [Scheffersomyces spartinae]|uniref:Sorting nexin-4 n=1 Tax=Scheffersomyces spartinae TaxID=45513 RepID=A0A9P8AIV3_9ASCO|nr:intercellular trafficking and secretion [Scheffersomyces spartinae]KAG7194788.1 intercellular trafficking and secretion [Scheffersomyces spartinae]
MTLEDQFTSVQWDRNEVKGSASQQQETITEEEPETQRDKPAPTYLESEIVEPDKEKETEQQDPGADDDVGTSTSANVETTIVPGDNIGGVLGSSPNSTSPSGEDEVSSLEQQFTPKPSSSNALESASTSMNKDQEILRQQQQQQQEEEIRSFEKYNISATVTTPTRELDTASKPYISYLITTSTNHPQLKKLCGKTDLAEEKSITIETRRRYGDFRFLHNCLVNDYPGFMTPPLPSKLNFKYLTGDTFSTDFVHKRLHSLDRFVKFILNHKTLSQSSVFHLFLSDTQDWNSFSKNLKLSKNFDTDDSIVNKVVNEDLLTETLMNFLTSSKHKRETNKDILEINDKLKKLYENLVKLDKLFSKLNKRNSDLSVDYHQFLVQLQKLSSIEGGNTTGNGTTKVDYSYSEDTKADSVPNTENHELETNLKVFSDSLEYFLKNWDLLHRYVDESFLNVLKDCAKYIISLTNLIELHHNKRIDLQVLQDYLLKARNDLVSLGGNMERSTTSRPQTSSTMAPPTPAFHTVQSGGIVSQTTQLIKDTISTSASSSIGSSNADNKIIRLRKKIENLENEIAIQTQLVNDLTDKIVNDEYPNWDKFNKKELKDAMVSLCDEEINFYKGLIDNWSEVESKLTTRLEELG